MHQFSKIIISFAFSFALLVSMGRLSVGQEQIRPGDLTLQQIPGYEKVEEIGAIAGELARHGRVSRWAWSENEKFFNFTFNKERMSLNLADFSVAAHDPENKDVKRKPRSSGPRKSFVGRAKQRTKERSPDGKWNAVYRDFNVWLDPHEKNKAPKIQVTKNGNEKVRFGTCCWVYGEELDQDEAMWWSPDGNKLVFYEVDESHMRDYHLTVKNTSLYTKLKTVRYPKAGDANPKVGLWVYDMDSGESKRIEIPGEDPEQYVYNIRFVPDGSALLFNRTNRQQNILTVFAADLEMGQCREVLTETQETWQENSPAMRFLDDSQRFVWGTEANGWLHFQLRHIDGRLLNPLSKVAEYPCKAIVSIDEEAGLFYYTAFSDKNPYNQQLHRAKLDGSEHVRITTSPLNHTFFSISPGHDTVVAVREQFDTPLETVVYRADTGKEVASLAKGNRDAAERAGLSSPELFSFTADDGETEIWGTLHKPSNFDPDRKYPLIIDVYGGPGTSGISNRYSAANPNCEMGYLIAKIGNRGTIGRGKAFESATYKQLGIPDLDDQAAGVRFLAQRPYVDGDRVGIYGHSYGGYMSALALLRYPEIFDVAVAGAPVTDWKNYDTIYTERYMQTPRENPVGYKAGSCGTHVRNLKGKLLLVHGLVDDNVHPSNTWQLVRQLQTIDKRFDLMIYPGAAHGIAGNYPSLRWEYFYEHLRPDVVSSK